MEKQTKFLSYAERLKNEDYGECGAKEIFENEETMMEKALKLVNMIKKSKHVIVMTGAGISTSVGIQDFRGPNGVWTIAQKIENGEIQKKEVVVENSFEYAPCSITHQCIKKLVDMDIIKLVITQNVDSLHNRSGIPRKKISELHGNLFLEKCAKCGDEYHRDFDIGTCGFKLTGRKCLICGGNLKDMLLDWDDALPDEDLDRANDHCEIADLCIVLGSSMKVKPANELPEYACNQGSKIVVINLQGKHI
eukprot:TRINITY_DN6822_c0_g1_i1.p1 TRINITY_DN6822_c0_g1~~TRINITY_DN6822_c0_g1_i1.p1  ORF type:complete len:250 (-),score=72.37 TRINITY_DN6822_c0_g1_i1:574-1323(-)